MTPVLQAAQAAARAGSWVAGFVSYEAAEGLDPHLRVVDRPPDDPLGAVPLAWFGLFADRCPSSPLAPPAAASAWHLDWSAADHAGAVADIKERIAAGLTYQVNLTARAHAIVDDAPALYASMLRAQAGGHNALIDTPTHIVACASPELFFQVAGGRIRTRPMKGTARRGRWLAEDEDAASFLRRSEKNRAENVMIVDLLRNDIGRIAAVGSVEVPSLFDLERYPSVWQLTSTVEGEIDDGVALADVFTALFPSGSVTGAPKRSTMDAIAELEGRPRGVYCGAVGFVEPGPALTATFAVAIRTASVNRASGFAEYGTGGGITWTSDAADEWDELRAKTTILEQAAAPGGLFETMRCEETSGIANLGAHLDRMSASAAYFGWPFDLAAAAALLVGERDRARVRLDLTPDGRWTVTREPLPAPSCGPVRVGVTDQPISSRDPVMFHKVTDRRRYESRRRPGVDDVVLVNERGEVTETTVANLAVRIGGTWWTPALDCGLLPGVERGRLLALGRLRERVITVADLFAAEDVALVSALRGWRPAEVVRS